MNRSKMLQLLYQHCQPIHIYPAHHHAWGFLHRLEQQRGRTEDANANQLFQAFSDSEELAVGQNLQCPLAPLKAFSP